MEGDRLCASTNSSCIEKDPLPLLPIVTDAPWQIIDKKKKKKIGNGTTDEVKTINIQDGFVAAKGSVPLKSGKKRKFEGAENMSESN